MEVDEVEEMDREEEPDITPLMPVVIEELHHTEDRGIEMEEFVEAEPIHVEQLNHLEADNENISYGNPDDVTEYETAEVVFNVDETVEDKLTKQFISGEISFLEYSSTLDREGDFESSDLDMVKSEGGIKLRNTEARMKYIRKRKTLPVALQGLMGEANVRFAKGETEIAARMCFEIIRQVPSAPEPFQTLAMIYENDQPEKSLQFALIAAHLSPRDADQWVRLANLSLESNNLKQAVTCYSKAIIASPKDHRLYDARAQLQERLGDKKSALRGYVRLIHVLGPEDAGLIMSYAKMLAKQFMQENNYEQAFHAMDNLFNKCPDMVTLGEVNIMVELLIVLKKFHRCLELLQKYTSIWVSYGMIPAEETMVISATELKKETSAPVRYIEACGIPDDVPVDLRAKCLIALIELNELQVAETLLPNLYENENPEISGDLFLDIAEALMGKKQFVKALSLLEPLVHSSNYSLAAVWLRYAECWMGCGDVQKAIESYEIVCNLSPRHIEAKLELARLYEERNMLNEAIAILDQDPEDDVFDPDVLYKRTMLLFRTERFDEYFQSAICLFSRHCVVLRSKAEITALTKSTGLRQRLECLHLHRLSRGENLEDDNAPSFIRTDVPSFDEEFTLFLEVCDMACQMKRYGLLQKVCFSALTSKKFDCKSAHIMFLCLISCIHTNDTYHGFNVVRELIRTDPKPNYWNLLNVIIQRAEDSRHNRFMMRLLTREEVFSHLHILHANNCLVSGTYKYALNDYISLFKTEPSALLALLIAVTQLQMACQKFAARKNQIVVQALAFMQKYAQARGKGGEQETSYNLGRAFHQLGLIPAAVHYYKQVLTLPPPRLVQRNSELLDLKREAAFNLHLIYLQSDNRHLANMYIQNFITI